MELLNVEPPQKVWAGGCFQELFHVQVEMPRAGRAPHVSHGWQRVGAAAAREAARVSFNKKICQLFLATEKEKKGSCLSSAHDVALRVTQHRLWPQLAAPGHQGQSNTANSADSPCLCCASTALCSPHPSLQLLCDWFQNTAVLGAPGQGGLSLCGAVPGSATAKLGPSQDLGTSFGRGVTGRQQQLCRMF